MISPETIKTAESVQRMFGSNYYTATVLLPKETRQAVFIFYAFVRLADEIVDNPPAATDAAVILKEFSEDWAATYHYRKSDNDIFLAFREICQTFDISYEQTVAFLDAMKQDLVVSRYETYEELQRYMYGSAEVIGVILTKLFGCADPSALPHARALGEAMQLTNFLRDVYEDATVRDRIYIPQQDLRKFSITEETLLSLPSSDRVKKLMQYEAERAHQLYERAQIGINMLPNRVRPAVRVAAALYEELLYELKKRDYAVQEKKITFSRFKKIRLALLYGYVKKR